MDRLVYLDDIKQCDKLGIYKWFSDIEFLSTYDYVKPIPKTKEQVDKMILDYENDENSILMAIRSKNNQILGVCGFEDIIKDNMVATAFIGIGDKSCRGKGYGKAGLNELINYGFNTLKLYRIQLNVIEFNYPAIKLYESVGFVREGIMKDFVLRNGKRFNLLNYAIFTDIK